MTKTLLSLAFGTLVTCNIAQVQETPIGGVEMGKSEATATSAINAACDRVARIEVMATRFPAAQFQIDCYGYEIFDEGRLALRKDIPEIRMVSDEIAKILATPSE